MAAVVPALADVDLLEPEIAPERQDFVQDFGEDQGIDNVPLNQDLFTHHVCTHRRFIALTQKRHCPL